jgi:hypothetical protein
VVSQSLGSTAFPSRLCRSLLSSHPPCLTYTDQRAPRQPCRWPLPTLLPFWKVSLYLNVFLTLIVNSPLADTSRPSSPAPATQKNESPSSQATRTAAKPKGPASRGGRYYSRGGKPRDSTQDGQEETPAGDERAPKKGESPTFFISLTCVS